MKAPPTSALDLADPGRDVLVIGYAREGKSAARFLATRGAMVAASDRKIRDRLDEDGVVLLPEDSVSLDGVDAVLVSPGIPDSNPLLAGARARGIFVTNATQLFLELCPCPVIGITGSSGKSTTTSLIASILRQAGNDVGLGGNIGYPMLELLATLGPKSTAVLEMSSFQLDLITKSPHVAVITNLSPNHLDRHGSLMAYTTAKQNIVAHQLDSDFAVLNLDDTAGRVLGEGFSGRKVYFGRDSEASAAAFVTGDTIMRRSEYGVERVLLVKKFPLPGDHNLQNALAAVAATSLAGVPVAAVAKALAEFQGLPHRLQSVAELNGIVYIDDSIATSPERAAIGIASMRQPNVWIAGGRSKHLPWDAVLSELKKRTHTVVLLGEAAGEIESVVAPLDLQIRHVDTMTDAVTAASEAAKPGDAILLSPGCTSFDMFTDFEDRGRAFQQAVEAQGKR